MTALAGCGSSTTANTKLPGDPEAGIHKIRHVIVIVQENRSFDSYFGTYPGADGIPMKNGVPTVCSYDYRDPARACRPYYDPSRRQHRRAAQLVNSRRWTSPAAGWTASSARRSTPAPSRAAKHVLDPSCTIDVSRPGRDGLPRLPPDPELLGVRAQLRAGRPLLRVERRLERADARGDRVGLVGDVHVARRSDELSSSSADRTGAPHTPGQPWYPWTDLTWLLHRYDVSWAYYISAGMQPDCATGVMGCHLDPAERRRRRRSGTRCRTSPTCSRTTRSTTSRTRPTSSGRRRRARCRRCRG